MVATLCLERRSSHGKVADPLKTMPLPAWHGTAVGQEEARSHRWPYSHAMKAVVLRAGHSRYPGSLCEKVADLEGARSRLYFAANANSVVVLQEVDNLLSHGFLAIQEEDPKVAGIGLTFHFCIGDAVTMYLGDEIIDSSKLL